MAEQNKCLCVSSCIPSLFSYHIISFQLNYFYRKLLFAEEANEMAAKYLQN